MGSIAPSWRPRHLWALAMILSFGGDRMGISCRIWNELLLVVDLLDFMQSTM